MKPLRRKPNAAGSRNITFADFSGLTTNTKPKPALLKPLKRHSGRDQEGHVSIRHRGGGAKRRYRVLTTLEQYPEQTGVVQSIEYDPNRSARIALVKLTNGTVIYLLAPQDLKVHDEVRAAKEGELTVGNRLPLGQIPSGIQIHNIELYPNSKARLVRSAGTVATVVAKEGDYAHVRLPSGEVRKIHTQAWASIGAVSNPTHSLIRIGKAGRVRWMGRRPTVRGKAMYPAAHPHGGGEGVNPIGLKHPKTPWGKPALGYKTRRKRPAFFVVKPRRKKE